MTNNIGTTVVSLGHREAPQYVKNGGTRVARSISAFDPFDAVFRSDLFPGDFFVEDDFGGHYELPHMLWQLESGEWIAVNGLTVGYNGAGPGFAREALTKIGVPESDAKAIAGFRFCDARQLDDPATWDTSHIWPVDARTPPTLRDGKVVVHFGPRAESLGVGGLPELKAKLPDPDPSGFYRSTPEVAGWEAWLEFLDRPTLPWWAIGRREARIFTSLSAAENYGMVADLSRRGDIGMHEVPVSMIITQGRVEMWAYVAEPEGGRFFSDDALDLLDAAGLLGRSREAQTEAAARADSRGWARLLWSLRWSMRQHRDCILV